MLESRKRHRSLAESQAPSQRFKRQCSLLFASMTVILSVSLTVGLAELCFRFAEYIINPHWPAPESYFEENAESPQKFDPEVGWSLKPGFESPDGTLKVNRLGLRSFREFDFSADKGLSKRVLLLGDSMVFGMGVPQDVIFSEIINREQWNIVMVNTGVIGYCTGQEYLVQKKYSEIVKPDLTVLFYTQANDIWLNPRTDKFNAGFSLKNSELVYHPPQTINPVPLYQRAMIYRYLNSKYLFGKDFTYLFDKLSFEIWAENSNAWQVTQKILEAMKKLADKQGSPFVVVDIPTDRQIADPNQSRKRQQLLRGMAASLGIHYFDLLSVYPRDYLPLFLPGNSHWNDKGHRFIADFLVPILRQHLKETAVETRVIH